MEMPALRIRVTFDDCSVLSLAQRSVGMNHSWILIEQNQHPKISDVRDHLLHKFNLRSSCPNGILLFMEGFVLPSSESTRILKDKDIICVKRNELAVVEAIEGADACNLLNDEVNMREPVDNGVLLLANDEFDKETGGYESEHEEGEVVKSEDEAATKETPSKKRKASTKLKTSKQKKHRFVATDNVEDKVPVEDNSISDDEYLPDKNKNKKVKSKKEKRSGGSETVIKNVKSPSKVKRKKKHRLEVVFVGDENGNGKISKKTAKPNEEIKKSNAETSDENIEDDVKGVEQTFSAPDGAIKGPSRSARRKKAKRKWRRELAKSAQNPDIHVELEISKTKNEEATGDPEGPIKQYQVPKNIIKQEGCNRLHNGVTELVPCVVKPGHIRFEPLDEDEDVKHIEVPDVTFQWNGISKKKGQKWGLEKFLTSKKDDFDYQKATEEPFTMSTVDAHVPLTGPIDFDQLPLYSSPKEGDVIAYRVLELSSSWTPELSSFRVGRISYYDGDNIVLMPVQEYPIVLDKMDEEDGPENSLYKEDGSLEIKFAALADVRGLNQSNSDSVKAVSNGVNETAQVDEKNAASNLIFSNNDKKENLSKDPTSVVGNKEGMTWTELQEFLSAKKSELMETNEEMKKDSGRNKWSYRALRGSALGPTISLLRSKNDI